MSDLLMQLAMMAIANLDTLLELILTLVTLKYGSKAVKGFLADKRLASIQAVAPIAFRAVEELGRLHPSLKGAAKTAEFLAKVNVALQAKQAAALNDDELVAVTDMARAMNVAERAAQAAASAIPSVPTMPSALK